MSWSFLWPHLYGTKYPLILINWSNVSQFVDHCLYNYIRIRVKDLTLPYLCTVLFEADMISMWFLKTLTLLLNLFHSHIKIIYNASVKTYKVTLRCEHLRNKIHGFQYSSFRADLREFTECAVISVVFEMLFYWSKLRWGKTEDYIIGICCSYMLNTLH
jgi:hypothetical protein